MDVTSAATKLKPGQRLAMKRYGFLPGRPNIEASSGKYFPRQTRADDGYGFGLRVLWRLAHSLFLILPALSRLLTS